MSKSFKRKLSGIIAFVMLFTTVFSNTMTAFADDVDYSFNVLLQNVAVDGVVKSGYVAGTGDSVKLFNGANGETDWKSKSDITLDDGTKITGYYAGKRDDNFLKDTTGEIDGQLSTLPADGQKVLFTAPENGIFLTYLSASKGVYVYEYGTDGKKIQKMDKSGAMIEPSLAFKVEKGHSYLITTTTGTNNCWYGGFRFLQDAPVTLKIVADASNVSMGDYQIELINDATKLVEATISDTAVDVVLTKNNSYTVRSQSITKKVTVNGSTNFTVDGSDLNLKIEDTVGTEVKGQLTSNNAEFDPSDIESITFKSTSWKGSDYTFTAEECINGNNYAVKLLPSEYETSIKSKSGNYKTYDHVSVPEKGSVTNEIYCEYEYTGGYAEIGTTYDLYTEKTKVDNGEKSVFTFSNALKAHGSGQAVYGGAGQTITFPVNGKAKITVSGWYSGTWNINGENEVTIESGQNGNAGNALTTSYVTEGPGTVTINIGGTGTTYLYQVKVEQAEATPVKSGIYYLPDELANAKTKFKFENIKANNTTSVGVGAVPATVKFDVNGAAKIKVGGWYAGTWNINGESETTANSTDNGNASSCAYAEYTTTGAGTVTINVTTSPAYLYTVEVQYVNPADEPSSGAYKWTPEIKVPGDYATLTEAVAAIKDMTRPDGEEGRVTITLTDDLQEQVLVDTPYVTLNGGDEHHELSWYYFTIGSYYSCDANGYYSERLFRDKYSKNPASGSLWGGVLIVKGDYFRAENVTLKNTCNYTVTDKEILDGAEDTVLGLRTKGMDVEVYADKERGNALYTDANYGEYYNCNILSSQDTLGVNGDRNTYQYFKNCVIGGNVDYICGAGTMVFDDCELQWKTYSDIENGKNTGVGYIVAPKAHPYVFRNCTVTTDKDLGETNVTGYFGRTWGANSEAYFINTKTNSLAEGWGEMNKGDNTTAKFYEYNSVNADGIAVAPTGFGQVLTDKDMLTKFGTDAVIADVLNDWTPVHYALSTPVDTEFVPEYNFGVKCAITGASVGNVVDKVASGAGLELTLTADEGFELPAEVQVTGAEIDEYKVAEDKATATLKIKNVTGAVTITVVATAKVPNIYKVIKDLANLTITPIIEEIKEGSDIEVTLTAFEGYALPENVTVTGGTAAYDKATGVLKITAITGDVTITAEAVKSSYTHLAGDYDNNGSVTASDAALIIKDTLLPTADRPTTSDADLKVIADVNGDGNVTASDAAEVIKKTLSPGGSYVFKVGDTVQVTDSKYAYAK